MNLLYIGRFYPDSILSTIIRDTKGKVGFSNHNFEMSLIRGFTQSENLNLSILTAPAVYSFPHNNRNPQYKEYRYDIHGCPVKSIGFCNLVFLNRLSVIRNLQKAIRKEFSSFGSDEIYVIVNTPSLELSAALFSAIRHQRKRIKTALIVPDIPECLVEMQSKSIKNIFVKLQNKITAKLTRRYDKYVFLTAAMNDFFNLPQNRFIVMEGLVGLEKEVSLMQDEMTSAIFQKEVILYTGSLKRVFGIMDLVAVFETGAFPDAELWICGSGECADEISKRAEKTPRIKFWGLVSSEEALRLQKQATILANPRSAAGRYTKYSFPSKTIEYLLAGKPVIMNRLPGVPPEYDRYLHYPDNEGTEAWVKKLQEIMALPKEDRLRQNEAARNFIKDNKTAYRQCRKILDFLAQN